jgi:cardiolipin synthase (CMP-forming)
VVPREVAKLGLAWDAGKRCDARVECGMHVRRELRALPNIISGSRIPLAAAFVAVDGSGTRLAILALAAATDFLDGWVARKANAISRWGALVDPIADRFFVLTTIATFLFEGAISTRQYFLFISRDLATAVGFLVARSVTWLRPVEFKARWSGKVVTGLQLATILAILVFPRIGPTLIALVAVASALSIGDYTLALWRARAR